MVRRRHGSIRKTLALGLGFLAAATTVIGWGETVEVVFDNPELIVFAILMGVGYYLLLRRRGLHDWNVSEITLTVEYHDDNGANVSVTRKQVIYPNRPRVRYARIGLSTGPEAGAVKQSREAWHVTTGTGVILGQKAPPCTVDELWFREGNSLWYYMRPSSRNSEKSNRSFPYPLVGILAPKKFPSRFFHLNIEGKTTYQNSYLQDDEYYILHIDEPSNRHVDKVTLNLILPENWSSRPEVATIRFDSEDIEMHGMQGRVEQGRRIFSIELFNCERETIRLDWRKGESEFAIQSDR